jgi:hypothetical protein
MQGSDMMECYDCQEEYDKKNPNSNFGKIPENKVRNASTKKGSSEGNILAGLPLPTVIKGKKKLWKKIEIYLCNVHFKIRGGLE